MPQTCVTRAQVYDVSVVLKILTWIHIIVMSKYLLIVTLINIRVARFMGGGGGVYVIMQMFSCAGQCVTHAYS